MNNGFEFADKMTDDEQLLFKRSIRKLLYKTFLLGDKDEKLYEFVSPESRQIDINRYLSLMGYKMIVEERMRLAMLDVADEDAETPGLRRSGLYRFKADEMSLLLALWLLFLERMGYEEPVQVTVGDIIDKCKLYKAEIKPADFKNAFQVFKRFSLIDYSNEQQTEESVVQLYPSLTFAFDIGRLKAVIAEYTRDDAPEDGFSGRADAGAVLSVDAEEPEEAEDEEP